MLIMLAPAVTPAGCCRVVRRRTRHGPPARPAQPSTGRMSGLPATAPAAAPDQEAEKQRQRDAQADGAGPGGRHHLLLPVVARLGDEALGGGRKAGKREAVGWEEAGGQAARSARAKGRMGSAAAHTSFPPTTGARHTQPQLPHLIWRGVLRQRASPDSCCCSAAAALAAAAVDCRIVWRCRRADEALRADRAQEEQQECPGRHVRRVQEQGWRLGRPREPGELSDRSARPAHWE